MINHDATAASWIMQAMVHLQRKELKDHNACCLRAAYYIKVAESHGQPTGIVRFLYDQAAGAKCESTIQWVLDHASAYFHKHEGTWRK